METALVFAEAQSEATERVSTIDEDWMTQFIEGAQAISGEDLRSLWAKILSNSVYRSRRVSYRALETIKVVDRNDALAFQAFLSGTFYGADYEVLQKNGLHRDDLARLGELDLIRTPRIEWNHKQTQLEQCYPYLTCILQSVSPHTIKVGDHFISVHGHPYVEMYAYVLSTTGEELRQAIGPLEIHNIDTAELVHSYIAVSSLRQRYTFKVDDEIEESERLSALAHERSYREHIKRDKQSYEEWLSSNRPV